MMFYFVSSLYHIASLGCWGLRNHRAGVGLEEQSSQTGQDFQGWDDVGLILGLGGWLDLMVK